MMLRTTILLVATLTQAVRIDDDNETDFTNPQQQQQQQQLQQQQQGNGSQVSPQQQQQPQQQEPPPPDNSALNQTTRQKVMGGWDNPQTLQQQQQQGNGSQVSPQQQQQQQQPQQDDLATKIAKAEAAWKAAKNHGLSDADAEQIAESAQQVAQQLANATEACAQQETEMQRKHAAASPEDSDAVLKAATQLEAPETANQSEAVHAGHAGEVSALLATQHGIDEPGQGQMEASALPASQHGIGELGHGQMEAQLAQAAGAPLPYLPTYTPTYLPATATNYRRLSPVALAAEQAALKAAEVVPHYAEAKAAMTMPFIPAGAPHSEKAMEHLDQQLADVSSGRSQRAREREQVNHNLVTAAEQHRQETIEQVKALTDQAHATWSKQVADFATQKSITLKEAEDQLAKQSQAAQKNAMFAVMKAEQHAKFMVNDAQSEAKRNVEAVHAETTNKVAATTSAVSAQVTQTDAAWSASVDEAQKQTAAKLAAAASCSAAELKRASDEASQTVAAAKEDALHRTKSVHVEQNQRVASAQKLSADRVISMGNQAQSDPCQSQALSSKLNELQTISEQAKQRMITSEHQSAVIVEEAASIKAAKVHQTLADASSQIASMTEKANSEISKATNAANRRVSITDKEASDAIAQAQAILHAKMKDFKRNAWITNAEVVRRIDEQLKAVAERNSQALKQNEQHIHEIQVEFLKVEEKHKKDINEAFVTANRVHKVEETKTSADIAIVQIKDSANQEILSHEKQHALDWIARENSLKTAISNINAAAGTTVTKLEADAAAKINSEFKDVAATIEQTHESIRQATEQKHLHQADAEFRIGHINSNGEKRMSSMEEATKNGIDSWNGKALSQVDAHNVERLALTDHEIEILKDAAAEKLVIIEAEAKIAREKKTEIEEQASEHEKVQAVKRAVVEAKTKVLNLKASEHQMKADETAKQVKAVMESAEKEKAAAVQMQQYAMNRANLATATSGAADAQAEEAGAEKKEAEEAIA